MAGQTKALQIWRYLAALLVIGFGVLVIASCAASGGGTEGTYGRIFSGTVTDENGVGLEGVSVQLLESDASAVTTSSGDFTLPRVEISTGSVTFRLTRSDIDATVSLPELLPEQEVAVVVDIEVVESESARVKEIVVQPVATPTPAPQPTAVPSPTQGSVETPTPVATPIPGQTVNPTATSTAVPVGNTPTPQPTVIQTSTPTPTPEPECPGDFNDDGQVNLTDLSILLSNIGKMEGEPGFDPAMDLNHDGMIDNDDVAILQNQYFGTMC